MSKIYSRPRIRIPKVFLTNVKDSSYRKKERIARIFIIILIAFSTVKIVLDAISPIFDTLCKNKAKSIATLITNEQTTVVMKEHSYDELFTIEKDNEGNIMMINANIFPINNITSDIAIKIQNEINKKGKENIGISLGSFTGFKLLTARGPSIPIRIMSIGNIETDLRSEFIAKGINQTLHRVYLQVVCEVSILTPYNNIVENITNQVLLAENVIIGKIPETYYDIEGIGEEDSIEFIQ